LLEAGGTAGYRFGHMPRSSARPRPCGTSSRPARMSSRGGPKSLRQHYPASPVGAASPPGSWPLDIRSRWESGPSATTRQSRCWGCRVRPRRPHAWENLLQSLARGHSQPLKRVAEGGRKGGGAGRATPAPGKSQIAPASAVGGSRRRTGHAGRPGKLVAHPGAAAVCAGPRRPKSSLPWPLPRPVSERESAPVGRPVA
jgi:hypothetical protein